MRGQPQPDFARNWGAMLLTASLASARCSQESAQTATTLAGQERGATVEAVVAQLPPPTKTTTKSPPPPTPTPTPTRSPGTGPSQEAPTLLLRTDLACSVSVDGAKVASLKAQEMRTIPVKAGQHFLEATSEDGRLHWESIVEAKAGQMVVVISLATAGTVYSKEDFDRTLAGVWLGVSDLKVAGTYAASILNRAWGFHDQTLSTGLHTAHTYLKEQVESLKKITPSDPERKRMAEEVLQIAPNADKYIDLMTKAISEAQRANSWMGNPSDMYAQARALEPTIVFPSGALSTLKTSKSFKDALPLDRQVGLGLASDPRDFNLGAEYYQSTPNMLAVVVKGGLADSLSFRAGDRLISVNGQTIKSVWELKLLMRANAGRAIQVVVERQGKQQQRDVKVPAQLP